MGRKSTIPEIEERLGEPLGDFFRKHIYEGKKPPDLAKLAGISSENGL